MNTLKLAVYFCLHFSIFKTKRSSKQSISNQQPGSCQQSKEKKFRDQQQNDETKLETAKINNIK
jgi:hypothetical protein